MGEGLHLLVDEHEATRADGAAHGPPGGLRLLFVGTNRGPGGTESHLVSLALAMADAGHTVAAAVRRGDVIHDALAADTRIVLFPACFERTLDATAARAVARACRAFRPDGMIGTFGREYWPLAIVSRLVGVPLVLFRHLRQMNRLSARLLPRLVERMIFPSEFLREWAVTRRGVPRSSTRVLYNPVDTRRFRPCPELRRTTRARLGVAPDDYLVGFVGRLERAKGAPTLWRALEPAMDRCPALRALWVGHGEYEPELNAQIRRSPRAARHLRVPWTADIVPYYSAMDVLAFPTTWSETFGRVSVEAQACGVPVIATAGGGIPETMEPGTTGLLLPQDDVPVWTEAIVTLGRGAEARCRMGAAGRRFVRQHFDSPVIAAQFTRLLAATAAGARSIARGQNADVS